MILYSIACWIDSLGCSIAPNPWGFFIGEVVMVTQYGQQLELVMSALTNDIEDQ